MKTVIRTLFCRFGGVAAVALAWLAVTAGALLSGRSAVWLTLDDYSRAFVSWRWALRPFVVDPKYIENATWLPFQFAFDGVWIALTGGVYAASLGGSLLFSFLTVPALYGVAAALFSRRAAFLSVLALLSLSSFNALAFTNTATPYFNVFVLGFFLFYILYEQRRELRWAGLFSLFLLAANTVRPEGWGISLILLAGHRVNDDPSADTVLRLIAATLVFPVLFVLGTGLVYRNPFIFVLPTVVEFDQWYPQSVGHLSGLLSMKCLLYLRTFWESHPAVLVAGAVSMAWVLKKALSGNDSALKGYLLILSGMAVLLSAGAAVNLYGCTHPVRFLYPWLLLLIPLIINMLDDVLLKRSALLYRGAVALLACAALLNTWKTVIYDRPLPRFRAAELQGRHLSRLYRAGAIPPGAVVLTEYSYESYYPTAVHSDHPTDIYTVPVYGRGVEPGERVHSPNSQRIDLEALEGFVAGKRDVFILSTGPLKDAAAARGLALVPVQDLGESGAVYAVRRQ